LRINRGAPKSSFTISRKSSQTIDLRFMAEPTADRTVWDYPPVGSVVSAVVLGYMPNGELRLSIRGSHLRELAEET